MVGTLRSRSGHWSVGCSALDLIISKSCWCRLAAARFRHWTDGGFAPAPSEVLVGASLRSDGLRPPLRRLLEPPAVLGAALSGRGNAELRSAVEVVGKKYKNKRKVVCGKIN